MPFRIQTPLKYCKERARESHARNKKNEKDVGEKRRRKTSLAVHRQVRLDHAGFFGALAAGAAEVPASTGAVLRASAASGAVQKYANQIKS